MVLDKEIALVYNGAKFNRIRFTLLEVKMQTMVTVEVRRGERVARVKLEVEFEVEGERIPPTWEDPGQEPDVIFNAVRLVDPSALEELIGAVAFGAVIGQAIDAAEEEAAEQRAERMMEDRVYAYAA